MAQQQEDDDPHHPHHHYLAYQPHAPARASGSGLDGPATTAATSSSTSPSTANHPSPHQGFDAAAFRSHSSSFEADDERSVTGLRSNSSTASSHSNSDNHSVYGIHGARDREREDEQRHQDSSSEHQPGQSSATMTAGIDNSFGADDEDDHLHRHPPHRSVRHRRDFGAATAYAGEDTRLTSRKEIHGWYAYAFASETYVICAIASFIPILLESLARENGVLLSDRTTPCRASDASPPATMTFANAAAPANPTNLFPRVSTDAQCVVYILGVEINTASFAMYTFSISVLLQALLVVSISCAADHGNYRKTLLLAFAWTGSFAVMLYLVVSARLYLLGALLAVVSNTSFGASFVLLNSFLPLLVRHHPSLIFGGSRSVPDGGPPQEQQAYGDSEDHGPIPDVHRHDHDESVAGADDSTTALLNSSSSASTAGGLHSLPSSPAMSATPPRRSHEEQTSLELSLSTQISSKGIGIGYCAALFVQCVSIFIVFKMHNTLWSQRIVLFVIGTWWGIFTVPAAMWLRPRPGPPLPAAAFGSGASRDRSGILAWSRSWIAYLAYAWVSLFRTVRLARRLVDIVLFLAGWFLLSDAIATTSSTAVLFAKTQLRMEVWALGLINVISTSTGVVGAFSWAYISRRFRLKPLQTILACLGLFELIPVYGLLGYLPFVRGWGFGGLQQPWEMYPLAAVYGLVLGGLSSYCRSLYGELIPPGSEAAFYALYAITDKGSSVFGPAIVGAIIDASGEIRPAFWFLAALVGLPAPLLYFVDVERGKREGERLAAIIEGFQADGSGVAVDGGGVQARGDDSDGAHTPRAILGDYDDEEDIAQPNAGQEGRAGLNH
ncbi:autophagy protein [Niveomyces insectorum RCEF 264]|uniref:Autophagy-related protein n=1 Tax=Niveomyces insectorum RCEF 264 TaxID=1081102 RepID=A0A162MBS2_9HYPO|nr:autophagy protein [Niveomyces insectorum RCEF 264]